MRNAVGNGNFFSAYFAGDIPVEGVDEDLHPFSIGFPCGRQDLRQVMTVRRKTAFDRQTFDHPSVVKEGFGLLPIEFCHASDKREGLFLIGCVLKITRAPAAHQIAVGRENDRHAVTDGEGITHAVAERIDF